MANSSGDSSLFDCLDDDKLEELVVKLNALPSGKEFTRRVEAGLARTIGIEDATYEEIVDAHGDLVGFVDAEESRLPWWLRDFEWTVTSETLDSLTISAGSLDRFEQYPLDSTRIEDISLEQADSLINGLDGFLQIEEELSEARDFDVDRFAPTVNVEQGEFELPEKLFVIPEKGRVATSDTFETWFERVLNLCPPASSELTALLRVNTNLKRQHTANVLESEQVERLTDLAVFGSTDEATRAHNDAYYDALQSLLQVESFFDLDIKLSTDKDRLTTLQHVYYQTWAENTDRLSNEQQWLRAAKNAESIEDEGEYRFAEFAFRIPLRLDSSSVVFEDQEQFDSSTVRTEISEILEEYGHPANDD